MILREDFRDTEDLDGVFSGFDPEQRTYDTETWQYEGAEIQSSAGARDRQYENRTDDAMKESGRGESHGSGGASIGQAEPHRDETMQHPRCAFQVLKRHFARYTPEMVEEICGVPQTSSRGCAT